MATWIWRLGSYRFLFKGETMIGAGAIMPTMPQAAWTCYIGLGDFGLTADGGRRRVPNRRAKTNLHSVSVKRRVVGEPAALRSPIQQPHVEGADRAMGGRDPVRVP